MHDDPQAQVEQGGLEPLEAQVYLALVRNRESAGASSIATIAGIPRPSVYPVLKSLAEKNLIQNGHGYGSQFAALPPEEALPRLIATEKENLSERERLTNELIREFRATAREKQNAADER